MKLFVFFLYLSFLSGPELFASSGQRVSSGSTKSAVSARSTVARSALLRRSASAPSLRSMNRRSSLTTRSGPRRGETFVGYHGTSRAAVDSIVQGGLDPSRIGSASGTARGPGFYVARDIRMARDFSDNATQTGVVNQRTFQGERYSGAKGQTDIARVYARNFERMQPGREYSWGVMSGGSLKLSPNLARDLEAVFRPSTYSNIRIERHVEGRAGQPAMWRSHEAPF